MGLPNKDEVEGKFDQVKGKTKEAIGRATDDRELEDEGRADHASGKVEEGFGKAMDLTGVGPGRRVRHYSLRLELLSFYM